MGMYIPSVPVCPPGCASLAVDADGVGPGRAVLPAMPQDAAASACAATLDIPFDEDWLGAIAFVSLANEMLVVLPSTRSPPSTPI